MKDKTVYILLEEHEDKWAIRETNIVGIYTCMTKAKKALIKARKEDWTGLFKENGFDHKTDTFSKSEYIDGSGFVSLFIEAREVI